MIPKKTPNQPSTGAHVSLAIRDPQLSDGAAIESQDRPDGRRRGARPPAHRSRGVRPARPETPDDGNAVQRWNDDGGITEAPAVRPDSAMALGHG